MKRKISYLIALALPLAFGCTQGENKEQKEDAKVMALDTVEHCYTAVYDGDTALLDIKIIDSVIVEGNLTMKYAEKAHNEGIVKGKFHGDTLLVDYIFKTGENPVEYTNPLAFLKTDNNLKMGVGQIETAYGRSYFVKDKPISYESGKFDFTPNDCK